MANRFLGQAIAVLIAVSVLVSCTGTTEPAASVRIVPASQTVALEPSVHGPTLHVSVTMANTSSHPIYWWSCAVSLQRKADIVALEAKSSGLWQTVWSPICAAIAITLPPLKPGESVTVPISAVVTQAFQPAFDGVPGLYRVRFYLSTEIAGSSFQLLEDQSSSDPFTLVAQ